MWLFSKMSLTDTGKQRVPVPIPPGELHSVLGTPRAFPLHHLHNAHSSYSSPEIWPDSFAYISLLLF